MSEHRAEAASIFKTYDDALAWLYAFSDTERTGQFVRDREDNLARERALLAELDNPQHAYGITHIAGTKGKGSTSAMIGAILQAAGIRTGLYTQPDLHTFRERMRVDGQLIDKDEMARLAQVVYAAHARVGNQLGPYITYEIATALALLYFREAGARHAVVEVGLGGRLDATNVVEPMVSIITSISYDHMNVLGDTLAEIAGEKAGIIKPGAPVVTSARAPEAVAVIQRVCDERGVPLTRVGAEQDADCAYRYRLISAASERSIFDVLTPTVTYQALELGLLGEHQLENAAAAIATVATLREGGLDISEAAIRQGLRTVRWPARMQTVGRAPWLVVDSAHNADSFARLFGALQHHFSYEHLILVLGLMADKDIPGIVHEIYQTGVDEVVTTGWNNSRAAAPTIAAELLTATPTRMQVQTQPEVASAMAEALRIAAPGDMICVAGSVAFAGETLRWCAVHIEGAAQSIEIAGVDH